MRNTGRYLTRDPNANANAEGFTPDYCKHVICQNLRECIELSTLNPEADSLLKNGGVVIVSPACEMLDCVSYLRVIAFPNPKRKTVKG